MEKSLRLMSHNNIEANYNNLLQDVVQEVEKYRIQAAQQLTTTLIQLYFSIGNIIVDRQQRERWGKSVVERLASDLSKLTDTTMGFSTQNLWYMRQFYLEYKDEPQLQTLSHQVPWGQNILIFSQVKKKEERAYYLLHTIEAGWTRKVLLNQIKGNAYERQEHQPKTHNFNKALPVHLSEQAHEVLKSEYNLEFLGVGKPILEKQLENKLLEHLKEFLLELGYGFTFIGNQYRLTLKQKEYFVDLLFFHRKLKCLIAIDLKIGEFEPEFAGKMNFYLNLLNAQVKMENENPSIGIILCASKDNVEVEYALSGINNPISIAEYKYSKKLPVELKNELPDVSTLQKKVKDEIEKLNKG